MLSPLTGKEALYDPCERSLGQDRWHLVRELDGAAYYMTEAFLLRCSDYPLSIATKGSAIARVRLHNEAGAIPAIVTEAEEMFMPYQNHAWAAPSQIYCAVYDAWE